MERLPYIDAHGVEVAADVESTWQALLRVARGMLDGVERSPVGRVLQLQPSQPCGPWSPEPVPGTALPGFVVERVRHAELLSLRGGHRFSRYRLDFELVAADAGRSRLWARTWAEFPGVAGAAYRALVIGSGGHRFAVRRILRDVADAA